MKVENTLRVIGEYYNLNNDMKTYAYKMSLKEYEGLKDIRENYVELVANKEYFKVNDIVYIFLDCKYFDEYKYGFFMKLRIKASKTKVEKQKTHYIYEDKSEKDVIEKNTKFIYECLVKEESWKNPLFDTVDDIVNNPDKIIKINFGRSTYTSKEHSNLKIIHYVRECIFNNFKGQYDNKIAANNIAALITKFGNIPIEIDHQVFINKLLLDNKEFWYDYPKRTVKELKNLINNVILEMNVHKCS